MNKNDTMLEIITDETTAELDAFIANNPKGHFMQTSLWAKQKPGWGWAAIVKRDDEGKIIGSLSVLIRKVPGLPFTLMYGCRGPVCDIRDEDTLRDLLAGAKNLARLYRSYDIKLDPDIPSSDERFKQLLGELGFKLARESKNFEGAQPRFVFRLDIAGKSEDEVMAIFSSKTRYNIRLAARKGVEVRIADESEVEAFTKIMVETGIRDGFITRPAQYFKNMLHNLGEHCRLYMAYHEGEPIAGTLAVWYGDKVWYLYGASSNAQRNLMPNYLLQWEMIRWAIAQGCRIYDFRGVSGDLDESNPLYGLYRFKRGFNGEFCEFAGEFDYIISPLINSCVALGRKGLSFAHKAKYRLQNRNAKPPESGEAEV